MPTTSSCMPDVGRCEPGWVRFQLQELEGAPIAADPMANKISASGPQRRKLTNLATWSCLTGCLLQLQSLPTRVFGLKQRKSTDISKRFLKWEYGSSNPSKS